MPPAFKFGPLRDYDSVVSMSSGLADYSQAYAQAAGFMRRLGVAGPAANLGNTKASLENLLETVGGMQRVAVKLTGSGVSGQQVSTRGAVVGTLPHWSRGFQCMFSLQSLDNVRFFAGECETAYPFSSPVAEHVSQVRGCFGLSYSTSLAHTTWHILSDRPYEFTAAPVWVDTGVPVSTDVLVYDHKTHDGSSFKVTLYDPVSREIVYRNESLSPSSIPGDLARDIPAPNATVVGMLQLANEVKVLKVYYTAHYPIAPLGTSFR